MQGRGSVSKRSRNSIKEKPESLLHPVEVAEPPLRIGSFQLQILGPEYPRTRSQDNDISGILANILKHYDLLLLMEARMSEETNIDRLIRRLNTVDRTNPFDFEESQAPCRLHGLTEHFCFFYRVSRLSVVEVHQYGEDPFRQGGWDRTPPQSRAEGQGAPPYPPSKKPATEGEASKGRTSIVTFVPAQPEPSEARKPLKSASDGGQQREGRGAGPRSPVKRASASPSPQSGDSSAGSKGSADTPSRSRSRSKDPQVTVCAPPLPPQAKCTPCLCFPLAAGAGPSVQVEPLPPLKGKSSPTRLKLLAGSDAEEDGEYSEHEIAVKKSCSSMNLLDHNEPAFSPALFGLGEVSTENSSSTDLVMQLPPKDDCFVPAGTAGGVGRFQNVYSASTSLDSASPSLFRKGYTAKPKPNPAAAAPRRWVASGSKKEVIVATLAGPLPVYEDTGSVTEQAREAFEEPILFSFSRIPFVGGFAEGGSPMEDDNIGVCGNHLLSMQQRQAVPDPNQQQLPADILLMCAATLGQTEDVFREADDMSMTTKRMTSQDNDTANNAHSSVKQNSPHSTNQLGIRPQDWNQQNNPDPDESTDSFIESEASDISDISSVSEKSSGVDFGSVGAESSSIFEGWDKDSMGRKMSVRFRSDVSMKFTPNRFQSLSIAETSQPPPKLSLCCCTLPCRSSSAIFQKEYKMQIKEDPTLAAQKVHNSTKQPPPNATKGTNQNAHHRNSCRCPSQAGQPDNPAATVPAPSANTAVGLCHCSTDAKEELCFKDLTVSRSDTCLHFLDPKHHPPKCWSCKDDSHIWHGHKWGRYGLKYYPAFSGPVDDSHSKVCHKQQHQPGVNNEVTLLRSFSKPLARGNQTLHKRGSLEKLSADHQHWLTESSQELTDVDAVSRESVEEAGTVGTWKSMAAQTQNNQFQKQPEDTGAPSAGANTGHSQLEQSVEEASHTHSSNKRAIAGENPSSEVQSRCTEHQFAAMPKTSSFTADTPRAPTQTDQGVPCSDQLQKETDSGLICHVTPSTEGGKNTSELTNNDKTPLTQSKTDKNTPKNRKALVTHDTDMKHKHRNSEKPQPPEKPASLRKKVEPSDNQTKAGTRTKPQVSRPTKPTVKPQANTCAPEIKVTPTPTLTTGTCDLTANLNSCASLPHENRDTTREKRQPHLEAPADSAPHEREDKGGQLSAPQNPPGQNTNSNADGRERQASQHRKKDAQADRSGGDKGSLARVFCREPFGVLFLSPSTAVTKFAVIAIHTDDCDVKRETLAIQRLYDVTAKKWRTEDIVLAGDFVMVESARGLAHWRGLEVKSDRRFCPPCGGTDSSGYGTVSGATQQNYDRMVVAGQGLSSALVAGGLRLYRYDKEQGLTFKQTGRVSDHYPIEIQIGGMVKTRWSKHVRPSVGVVIEQVQPAPAASVQGFKSTAKPSPASAGFLVDFWEGSSKKKKEIRAVRHDVSEVMAALRDFQQAFPEVLRDTSLALAASVLASSCMTACPIYGFRFAPQAPTFDLEVTVSLKFPHTVRLSIQRPLCDGCQWQDQDEG